MNYRNIYAIVQNMEKDQPGKENPLDIKMSELIRYWRLSMLNLSLAGEQFHDSLSKIRSSRTAKNVETSVNFLNRWTERATRSTTDILWIGALKTAGITDKTISTIWDQVENERQEQIDKKSIEDQNH